MPLTLTIIRFLFIALCASILSLYSLSIAQEDSFLYGLIGALTGTVVGSAITGLEVFGRQFSIRTFNAITLGLIFGYLMGSALTNIIETMLTASSINLSIHAKGLISLSVMMTALYMGLTITLKANDEIYLSIPFIRLSKNEEKKRDFLLDQSILMDSRLIDLASSGILDNRLIVSKFMIKELQDQIECPDESMRNKSRKALDNIRKLENMSCEVRYDEQDFPEIKDPLSKLIRVARHLEANVLTADNNLIQRSLIEGIRFINLNTLANALKPLAQMGEMLNIKIQRYGKEPRQGVGYLDDGTMVVVNGGAEFIGETIQAQVLSVKHTSSGRMVFCNALDDTLYDPSEGMPSQSDNESHTAKTYFTV